MTGTNLKVNLGKLKGGTFFKTEGDGEGEETGRDLSRYLGCR